MGEGVGKSDWGLTSPPFAAPLLISCSPSRSSTWCGPAMSSTPATQQVSPGRRPSTCAYDVRVGPHQGEAVRVQHLMLGVLPRVDIYCAFDSRDLASHANKGGFCCTAFSVGGPYSPPFPLPPPDGFARKHVVDNYHLLCGWAIHSSAPSFTPAPLQMALLAGGVSAAAAPPSVWVASRCSTRLQGPTRRISPSSSSLPGGWVSGWTIQ